jgi:hypothetical protein
MRARLVLLAIVATSFGAAVSAAGCSSEPDAATGSGGSGGTGSASSTAATTGPGAPSSSSAMVDDKVGESCTQDTQCGMNGKCIKVGDNSVVLGGGPSGGYCTLDCKVDADCPGTTSICLTDQNDENGICLRGCELGPPLMGIDEELDSEKCWGREDVRCQEIANSPVCVPTCGSDSQCEGRMCDPGLKVCVDMASTGFENGAVCNPMAMMPECAGICVSFTVEMGKPPITMCSEWCVLGGELNTSADCGGLTEGVCAFLPTGNGAGDFGVCAPACSKHDDCQNPNFWCTAVNFHNANGFCFGHPPCMTQADCSAMAGEVCTDTKFGKYCIDDGFDLGTSAPTGGGGAGGGGGLGLGGAGGLGLGGAGGAGGGGGN